MNHDYQEWIGKTTVRQDFICPILTRRMAATLNTVTPTNNEALPHLWHWMFFQPEVKASELGPDGHPALGNLMPPVGTRNRMWAGGSLHFHTPLIIGQAAECRSQIETIEEKHNQTGSLIFVTLRHDYHQQQQLALTERQNIVYRQPGPPKTHSDIATASAEWTQEQSPDPALLFRYSAVTFNSHRIHYDYPYVTETEGYSNLVVHGPLMATWGLHAFLQAYPDKTITSYEYRGIRPSLLPDPIRVCGRLNGGNQAEVWLENDNGIIQKGSIGYL